MSNILKPAMMPYVVTPEMFTNQQVRAATHGHMADDEAQSRKHHAQTAADSVMPSLGLLDGLMHDDSVNDILVNGMRFIYVDRDGKLVDSGLRFSSDEEVWNVAEAIMQAVGQHWMDERPIIDTRLPDGSRVNLVGPPIAVDGVSISIRKFPKRQITLDSMAGSGQITSEMAVFLKECTRARINLIISGGTSTGKTTLLNALSAAVPADERIVTIEDSAELRLMQPHVVRLESKPTKVMDKVTVPEVTTRDLVKNALRMRPDRIIVGESRGPEAFDVLQAMNTGHDGSMTTLHANSPRDALSRLETMAMVALPNLTNKIVRTQIASALNLVLQIARDKSGARSISHVTEVVGMEGDTIVMQDLMTYMLNPQKGTYEYRWSHGSPRNNDITEAAVTSGLMKKLR